MKIVSEILYSKNQIPNIFILTFFILVLEQVDNDPDRQKKYVLYRFDPSITLTEKPFTTNATDKEIDCEFCEHEYIYKWDGTDYKAIKTQVLWRVVFKETKTRVAKRSKKSGGKTKAEEKLLARKLAKMNMNGTG